METKYKRIKLSKGVTRDQHRLIMEEHIGRRLGFYEVVHHKNGDRGDNRLENLELMSRQAHGALHMKGKQPPPHTPERIEIIREQMRGEGSNSAKLTDVKVFDILVELARGDRLRRIAEKYGVSHSTISDINTGKAWTHVIKNLIKMRDNCWGIGGASGTYKESGFSIL